MKTLTAAQSKQLTDEKHIDLYKHFVKQGEEFLDKKYIEEWKEFVLWRIRDTYKGRDLTDCLEIIKLLNNGQDFPIVEKIFYEQDHSLLSSSICLNIIGLVCERGQEFKYYIKNKYIFTGLTREFCGKTLYQIQAIKDFGDVKKGDIGGWIENEKNLSHEGECWVYDEAIVCDRAIVCDNAKICNNSQVYNKAIICGNVSIEGESVICGDAWIYEDAKIKDVRFSG